MVTVSASVNLPLHHKVQKFCSGTGSPGCSWKKCRKTVVVYVIDSCNRIKTVHLWLLQVTVMTVWNAGILSLYAVGLLNAAWPELKYGPARPGPYMCGTGLGRPSLPARCLSLVAALEVLVEWRWSSCSDHIVFQFVPVACCSYKEQFQSAEWHLSHPLVSSFLDHITWFPVRRDTTPLTLAVQYKKPWSFNARRYY